MARHSTIALYSPVNALYPWLSSTVPYPRSLSWGWIKTCNFAGVRIGKRCIWTEYRMFYLFTWATEVLDLCTVFPNLASAEGCREKLWSKKKVVNTSKNYNISGNIVRNFCSAVGHAGIISVIWYFNVKKGLANGKETGNLLQSFVQ